MVDGFKPLTIGTKNSTFDIGKKFSNASHKA